MTATVDPLLVPASLFVAALSVIVVAQCYRGYIRNGSRPLLFLGAGVALVTLPSLLLYPVSVALGIPAYVDVAVVSQLFGLLLLLYAFTRA
ncbi:hypothetical protein EXE48_14165 [Halorubrum sp. ASP1]|uniref:DUF7521 family protein n=1 Tax=unclassified Halorubrum TaxID=2642239 RepID=UPI0010F71287|nr:MULTISPECIES: hypothetical protein [unclassified Halorubrum]TKX50374.1 hypothetical protein EXE49_07255 [Halorubrum sp. ASP121]TKX59892.1 hypothetical protein EXE48_14165 [Halorubrum sp. ASP1]